MATSSYETDFLYPDPSFFGLIAPPPPSQPHQSTVFLGSKSPAAPVVAAPAAPFALDPALLALPGPATAPAPTPIVAAPAPAPAPAPIAAPGPAPRLSAAGLQPFPALYSGLQAPIELTNSVQIARWDEKLLVSFDNSRMGLRNRRLDTNDHSQANRQSRARGVLKDLWQQAGGVPHIKRQ